MYIVSVSYGNDSIALLQFVKEKEFEDVYVVFADTGWAHPEWKNRVKEGIELAERFGFTTWNISDSIQFSGWVKKKKMFPTNKYQWCTSYLKLYPFMEFLDFIDPNSNATLIVGKRRAESKKRESTQEYEDNNSFYENHTVWNPLYLHTDAERNKLILKTGLKPLPHRSLECCPCVNANRRDLLETPKECIDRVRELEKELNRTFFSETRYMGAKGIDEVIQWARSAKGTYHRKQLRLWERGQETCPSGLCGL